jgi:hypothetical protein
VPILAPWQGDNDLGWLIYVYGLIVSSLVRSAKDFLGVDDRAGAHVEGAFVRILVQAAQWAVGGCRIRDLSISFLYKRTHK